jgi:hypothetical protein
MLELVFIQIGTYIIAKFPADSNTNITYYHISETRPSYCL